MKPTGSAPSGVKALNNVAVESLVRAVKRNLTTLKFLNMYWFRFQPCPWVFLWFKSLFGPFIDVWVVIKLYLTLALLVQKNVKYNCWIYITLIAYIFWKYCMSVGVFCDLAPLKYNFRRKRRTFSLVSQSWPTVSSLLWWHIPIFTLSASFWDWALLDVLEGKCWLGLSVGNTQL